jgi:SAM-dependent methyltransferase
MTAVVAEVVGPDGHVVGVDADEQAVQAATSALAGVPNAEVRSGRAENTGLAEGSFDVVMLRHVLPHNGGAEQRIVNHLARLARPGGRVYLVDGDATSSSITPVLPEVEELMQRYLRWHTDRGDDLRIGRRLAELGRAAGLTVEEFRGWFNITEIPPSMRGPAWAARESLIADGLATEEDFARWATAFDEIDSWTERPQFIAAMFAAVCQRPT